jgi:dTDP-4-dehydrorhamnose reductase
MKSHGGPSVLLLGGSGFFGPALAGAFGAERTVVTHFRHAGPGSVRFDARTDSIADLVRSLPSPPPAAIVLFGITGIDACARDPSGTAELNVHAAVRAVDELRALGIVPVFASSDAVFDGTRSSWTEDDAPRPILEYGRQKLEVERHLASLPPPWMVIRLPKLLSPGRDPRCMVGGWVEALGRRGTILCATDQFFTPASAADAAAALAMLVRERAQGLFHVAGPERISRRALLGEVIDEYSRFAAPLAQVVDCALADVPVVEARPRDTSLGCPRLTGRLAARLGPASEVARAAVRSWFQARTRA